MGHHLTKDGKFKSDKFKCIAEGYFVLSFKDPLARKAMLYYADLVMVDDEELGEDLRIACANIEKENKS